MDIVNVRISPVVHVCVASLAIYNLYFESNWPPVTIGVISIIGFMSSYTKVACKKKREFSIAREKPKAQITLRGGGRPQTMVTDPRDHVQDILLKLKKKIPTRKVSRTKINNASCGIEKKYDERDLVQEVLHKVCQVKAMDRLSSEHNPVNNFSECN